MSITGNVLTLACGWGRDYVNRLLVRDCYKSLQNEIVAKRQKTIVDGSPGIGKSLFIYFFIYSLVAKHLDNQNHQIGTRPTFVISDIDGKCYYLGYHPLSNEPIVQEWSVKMRNPDYFLSDTKAISYDAFTRGYIHVTSISNVDPVVEQLRKEIGESGREWTMPPFSFEEYLLIAKDANWYVSRFKFDVFGGSARLLRSTCRDIINSSHYNLILEEMEQYFLHVDYSFGSPASVITIASSASSLPTTTSSAYFLRSNSETRPPNLVKEIVGVEIWQGVARVISGALALPSNFTKRSIFWLEYVYPIGNSFFVDEDYASNFMKRLAGAFWERRNQYPFSEVASLFAKNSAGVAFVSLAHETLFQILNGGGSINAQHLAGSGYVRRDERIQVKVNRKVFIRTIEDIRLLQKEDYGIPVIPNFSLVDAIIYPNILLQMTISSSHKEAKGSLNQIKNELSRLNPKAAPVIIFVLRYSNFKVFKKVPDLDIKQYKWESSLTSLGKRKNSEINDD